MSDLACESGVLPTGHALLDSQLPGGGWPVGSLVELLLAPPQTHVWQLLLPALAAACRQQPGPIVLVGAPHPPFAPSLQAQGLPAERLLWIRPGHRTAALWAAEQALRCADVTSLLVWLPTARTQELRRLHLAARQHRKLLFGMREPSAQSQASPAPLRLAIEGVENLQVRILKRKGPVLDQPIALPGVAERVRHLLASRRRSAALPVPERRSHVLDRLVPTS